jgi:hypothetical protein
MQVCKTCLVSGRRYLKQLNEVIEVTKWFQSMPRINFLDEWENAFKTQVFSFQDTIRDGAEDDEDELLSFVSEYIVHECELYGVFVESELHSDVRDLLTFGEDGRAYVRFVAA